MQHPVIGHDEAKSAVTFREMRTQTSSTGIAPGPLQQSGRWPLLDFTD